MENKWFIQIALKRDACPFKQKRYCEYIFRPIHVSWDFKKFLNVVVFFNPCPDLFAFQGGCSNLYFEHLIKMIHGIMTVIMSSNCSVIYKTLCPWQIFISFNLYSNT